jgi:DNA modification methylase
VTVHELRAGRIHVGDWREADLRPGYSLAIVDGPYAMGTAAWDRMKLDDLADWYEPHLSRLTGLMAASASVYLWNTAAGWARLDPVMRGLGWTFRALIAWDKVTPPALIGWRNMTTWIDQTESCGFYTRGAPGFNPGPCPPMSIWKYDASNELRGEKLRMGGPVESKDGMYKCKESLHPCQKPLLFAERMIRASSRPGDHILVPFGGTCREAVVCEWLARSEPEQVREYDVCELNQDGRDYIGPVLAQIRGQSVKAAPGQLGLFERAA